MLVRDVMSGRDIDIQALMRVAEVNELVPLGAFSMSAWIAVSRLSPCGTVACLLGNYCVRSGDPSIIIDEEEVPIVKVCGRERLGFSAAMERFGLSQREAYFIFAGSEKYAPEMLARSGAERPTDRMSAIRRLRKFIYYKLHKSELLADYDAARKTGDAQVVDYVEAMAWCHANVEIAQMLESGRHCVEAKEAAGAK